MRIRRRTYIAIAPAATPDLEAGWLSACEAVVQKDARGTLITFEENQHPLFETFQSQPDAAQLHQVQLENDLSVWLGAIGRNHFRLVRCGDEIDSHGYWGMRAFVDDPEVKSIHRELIQAGVELEWILECG